MGVWTKAPGVLKDSLRTFRRQLTTVKKYDQLSVGVPKERFEAERRVAITPEKVAALRKSGVSEVRVEASAGVLASFADAAYAAAGAKIVEKARPHKIQFV